MTCGRIKRSSPQLSFVAPNEHVVSSFEANTRTTVVEPTPHTTRSETWWRRLDLLIARALHAAQICRALIFLNVQADARDTSGPVSQLLGMAPPPSFTDANYSLLVHEAVFFVEVKPCTFQQRAKAARVPLPLPPGCQGLRFVPFDAQAKAEGSTLLAELEQRLSHDQWEPVPERVELWSRLFDLLEQRPDLKTVLTPPEELEAQIQMQRLGHHPAEASLAAETPKPLLAKWLKPLFCEEDAFRKAVEELLPREGHILLDAGLVLAGGFLGRIGAWLAGLCDEPPTADAKGATCDIDFFPLGSPEEALESVRRALIALAKDCESTETGMFVVRSPHALTIGMDDCCFDLQIVLCTAETPPDILAKFDIDASRLAPASPGGAERVQPRVLAHVLCSTTWCSSSSTHTPSAAAGATAAATSPPPPPTSRSNFSSSSRTQRACCRRSAALSCPAA